MIATETMEGSYEHAVYCTICTAELMRERFVIPVLPTIEEEIEEEEIVEEETTEEDEVVEEETPDVEDTDEDDFLGEEYIPEYTPEPLPQTGDTTNYAVAGLMGILALVVFLFTIKKKEQE